jgi:hypothetical protein
MRGSLIDRFDLFVNAVQPQIVMQLEQLVVRKAGLPPLIGNTQGGSSDHLRLMLSSDKGRFPK